MSKSNVTNARSVVYNHKRKQIITHQGFQYYSSIPVLHYLQAVLFIKI